MGNSMSAITSGEALSYYNPALLPWIESRQASASFGILSLDRTLNFLSYSQQLPPMAGLTLGVINSGVSNIDGRNSDGDPTGALRTSENEFFLGFGMRFSADLSVGLNAKLYYYHLYTDINSFTSGLDFGALYRLGGNVTLAATVRDVNSKYKWDTSTLYGQLGQSSENLFPLLYTVGAAYALPDSLGIITAEVEASNARTTIARFGIEVQLIPELTVRGGMDRIDVKEKGNGVRPAVGFTARKSFERWTPAVHYAFVFEPFSPSGMHVISLSAAF
jgi:hypothetical protein